MSASTIQELRAMQPADLRKEVRAQQTVVRKMRIEITMNTEKDTARYRRERKQLARMLTVLTEGTKGTKGTKVALQSHQTPARVATPKSRSRSRKSSSSTSAKATVDKKS